MSRALIIDDTELGQHALSEELRGVGFDVYSMSEAYAAMAAFPEVEPSVVVVDFQLPGLDGIEFIERIRSFSEVPAILITAYGSPGLTERALAAGAHKVLDFNTDLELVGKEAKELVRAQAEHDALHLSASPARLRKRKDVLRRAELEKALLESHGNVSEAARIAGMSRGALRYQMKRLGLWDDDAGNESSSG